MTDWLRFFTLGWGLPFTVYVVLQVVAVLGVRGKYRVFVLFPALIGLSIIVWTIHSYRDGGNLWPLAMIYGGPVAAILVIALWVGAVVARRTENRST
jgi:hypothetical protein